MPQASLTLNTKTPAGESCAKLRSEIAALMERHESSFELSAGGKTLEDTDKVPDSPVTITLVNLSWEGATPARVKDLGGGEFTVVGEAMKGSGHFNFMCNTGFTDGVGYFEVEVLEGDGPFIGVTTKAGFKEGYKIRALEFGGPGNLSDGSCGKRIGFGEPVKKGSVIGFTLDLTDDSSVGMTVWDGDKCLGEAYKGCKREKGATVYPVVCARKPGDRFKLSLKRQPRVQEKRTPHPAHNSWELTRFVQDGATVSLDEAQTAKGAGRGRAYIGPGEPPKGHLVMQLEQSAGDANEFKLHFKLFNILNTKVTITGSSGSTENLDVGMIASTRMMSPIQGFESQLSGALSSCDSWTLTGSGENAKLTMRSSDVELGFDWVDKAMQEPVSDVALP
ncbi:unnamed protein product [Symbiodinium natans]|uniref:B30.2/SPRY domain-containing protein n=1 Tax=Symbiodinium natans TaxID=878477 RepID=A0A812LTA1_9DINO|nr:unnamed protein product [Symbiodinium natans]